MRFSGAADDVFIDQDDGATAVAEALTKTAPLLRVLDFSGNELTAEGGAAVAACAATKASLEYLGLEDNEIGSAGAKAVCYADIYTAADYLHVLELIGSGCTALGSSYTAFGSGNAFSQATPHLSV